MKFPAIRAQIGIWSYYTSVMSFADIKKYVNRINDELHKSSRLSEMIQRSITNNFKSIREYILTQDERFFNALVLAVYDGDPKWVEVELNYKGEEFFNLGFLDFNGKEKIFPVDGQHRVEGIRAALKANPELANDKVPVILIGHKKDEEGMQRTRRMFTTLNRYAKPVSMSDIIALDEDDVAAIVTRDLVENFDLFNDSRVSTKLKAIPDTDKSVFTSIITLYQCNCELLRYFLKIKGIKKSLKEYTKVRPQKDEIQQFKDFCISFWKSFTKNLNPIKKYLSSNNEFPASEFRNKETGGNLLFRPIGLYPFILASIELAERQNKDFNTVLKQLNKVNLTLNKAPWKQVLWNDYEKTMLRSDNALVKLLLMYQVNQVRLTEKELSKLRLGYAAKLGYEEKLIDDILEELIQ